MPSKNVLKPYIPHAHYHIYNRGVNRQRIFRDHQDYQVFLSLFKNILSPSPTSNHFGRLSTHLYGHIELESFCLMPNHFHILIYQSDARSISKLMQSLTTSYVMYFNKKYQRTGRLFQNCYRASHIDNDHYLKYITHYIHMNPTSFERWEYSSLNYYIASQKALWLNPNRVLTICGGKTSYIDTFNLLKPASDLLREEFLNVVNTINAA